MACAGDSETAWTGETPGAVLGLLKDGNTALQQRIEVVRQNGTPAPRTDDEPAVAGRRPAPSEGPRRGYRRRVTLRRCLPGPRPETVTRSPSIVTRGPDARWPSQRTRLSSRTTTCEPLTGSAATPRVPWGT